MRTILQNVVFPVDGDPDVLPLYIDADTWGWIDKTPIRLSAHESIEDVTSRTSLRVREGRRVSLGTYFNAFPAAYWQRWTRLERVALSLVTSGTGTLLIYRSNSFGAGQLVDSRRVSGEGVETVFDLPVTQFGDGGWYWFDAVATDADFLLDVGDWSTTMPATLSGKLSIGMTTYNKPDYCVETLSAIAESPELASVIDRIFLIDQGTKHVRDEPGFEQVRAELGDLLQIIEQGNLGGSGGFSRSMAETLQRDDSDFLLLLDDDIGFEPESALRAYQFSRFSREPVLVGGHMFDLLDKPVMHAWAEVVRPEPFLWGPSFEEQHRHDFRLSNLRQTPWMHARLDSDYKGWWMCMIPKRVIEEIGLSLPVFIKWDDAEYGLRAKEAGYRTVSLPGVALWHISWLDKDDTQDWQAFFHTRNRVIAGLLHSTRPRGGTLLRNNGRQDIKKLLNMQYYATQLAVDALRSVLEGPDALHGSLARSMPAARERARDFSETRVYRPADEESPVARGGRVLPTLEQEITSPTGARLAWFTLKMLPKHWFRSTGETERLRPELEYPKREAFWWRIPSHTSVLVGTADGSGKMWYHHDRAKFRRLYRESRRLTKIITRRWDQLARDYREALPRITSVEEWNETFEGRGGDTA